MTQTHFITIRCDVTANDDVPLDRQEAIKALQVDIWNALFHSPDCVFSDRYNVTCRVLGPNSGVREKTITKNGAPAARPDGG
jgi:hypothetical protein